MFRWLWSVSLSIFVLVSIQPILSQVSSPSGESNPNGKGTTNSGFASRTELGLDVTEAGVDCNFSSDSSAALNAITARASSNGLAIVFPRTAMSS
jgi:hypothetical protein